MSKKFDGDVAAEWKSHLGGQMVCEFNTNNCTTLQLEVLYIQCMVLCTLVERFVVMSNGLWIHHKQLYNPSRYTRRRMHGKLWKGHFFNIECACISSICMGKFVYRQVRMYFFELTVQRCFNCQQCQQYKVFWDLLIWYK